jgi:hypothetical protein
MSRILSRTRYLVVIPVIGLAIAALGYFSVCEPGQRN